MSRFSRFKLHGRTSSTPNGSPPLVGPHANWNGTPNSGSGQILDTSITRTTGKPAAKWLQAGGQRLWQDTVIMLDADAFGGEDCIQQVTWSGDIATTVQTAPMLYTDTDSRGRSRTRYGWGITLDHSAFVAISSAAPAEIRIYARIKPLNSGLQDRIIGSDLVNAEFWPTDWAMNFYPRNGESDFLKTVGSGQDYATIADALNAARAIGTIEAPVLELASGFHEATNGNSGTTGTTNAVGRCIIRPKAGALPVIRRAADYDPEDVFNTFVWYPGWKSFEFQGKVQLDIKNWCTLKTATTDVGPSVCRTRMNGAWITNSVGASSFRWHVNRSNPTSFSTINTNGDSQYDFYEYGVSEYTGGHFSFRPLVIGWQCRELLGSPLDHGACAIDLYFEYISEFTTRGLNGAGYPILHITGPAGYTATFTRGGQTTSGQLVIKSGGVAVPGGTITLGWKPSLGNMTASALVSTINALGVSLGVSLTATVINDNFLGPRFMHDEVANQDISGSGLDFNSYNSIHIELLHYGTENMLWRNVVTHGDNEFGTAILAQAACSDASFINCNFESTSDNGGSGSMSDCTHTNIKYCVFGGEESIIGSNDGYSEIYGSVIAYFSPFSTMNIPINGSSMQVNGSMPVAGNSPANISLGSYPFGYTSYHAMYVDKTAGDFAPAGGALSDFIPRKVKYDGNHQLRATSDARWPIKAGGSSRSIPTFVNS